VRYEAAAVDATEQRSSSAITKGKEGVMPGDLEIGVGRNRG
jgi:hypothetical protein